MRLHLLGLPHTVSSDEYSHCAYTGKVQRFPAMMQPLGYEVVHYGVEGARTEAAHQVVVMTRGEQLELEPAAAELGRFHGDLARVDSPLYRTFNQRLRHLLLEHVRAGDLVLLPFGHGHEQAVRGLPLTLVESGVGYPTLCRDVRYRIFESYAWLHWHQGRADRQGHAYEWVIPNYYDVDAWDVELDPPLDTVVFFGRICPLKGLDTVVEVARRRPELRFILCGQGDPAPYLVAPNIEYRAPVTGRARSALLGRARAVLMPSAFTEPFGGVAVEAQLCGTPVVATTYGAFTETIEDRVTGWRCHTLGDFLAAIDRAPELDRAAIAARARGLYSLERVGRMYDRALRQIHDVFFDGWFSPASTFRGD